jgi:hypothetical protein
LIYQLFICEQKNLCYFAHFKVVDTDLLKMLRQAQHEV